MRRLSAVLFLLIMLSVAIHPVVAMHFCGNKIKSLHLYQIENNHACCHSSNSDIEKPSKSSCCTVDIPTESQQTQFDNHCCDFQVTQLSTDDFQKPQQQNSDQISLPLTQMLFLSTFVENTLSQRSESLNLKKIFPPEGLFFTDVDIRNYICIYRI